MSITRTEVNVSDSNIRRYAVFATKTATAQKEGDYTIWHYLNSTTKMAEAIHWKLAAEDNKDYDQVIILTPIDISMTAEFTNSEWADHNG